jgi:hypothetical protein
MPSEALKEILHSSRFLNNALHSVDRELDIAERDIEEKNYSALGNDIFRGKTSLKTAVDEANDIDATTRQALGMSKKEYKRIKFNSSGVRSTGDMRNRHGYETITHSGRVTFPTTPKKDEIKDAVTAAVSSAPSSVTKKTAEIAIGDDDINGTVSHALGKKSAEIAIGDDDINGAVSHALGKQDAYTNMYEDGIRRIDKITKNDRKSTAEGVRKYAKSDGLNIQDAPHLQDLTIAPIGDVRPLEVKKAVSAALSSHPGEASTAE